MSDSLWPLELQHARLPCLLLFPWVCSDSCPLSQWCHPTISSSVGLFTSCPQSSLFPASGSFPMSQLFTSEYWSFTSKYWSFSFSIRPSKEYSVFMSIRIDWFYVLAVHPWGHTLRQQLLKYASKSLWGKDWKMAISVCWALEWYLIKKYVCYSPIVPVNASPVDQMIKGCISGVAPAKPGTPDMTTTCFRRTLVTAGWPVLWPWRWSGENSSWLPHVCWIRSLTLRLLLLRYANWSLSWKDSEIGISDGCLCAEIGIARLFAVAPLNLWRQAPAGHQNQVIRGCVLCAAVAKASAPDR